MLPELISIGSYGIQTHGVFSVLGIIVAAMVGYFVAESKINRSLLFDNLIYIVLLGLIGARLTYFLLYTYQFSSWTEIFYFWEGGLASYGGFIVGAISAWLILRWQKQPVAKWFDLLALIFPLGLSIARFGEVLSGEDFSRVSGHSDKLDWVSVNAYEFAWCLIVFAVIFIIYRKRRERIKDGFITKLSILLYSGGRFIIDFGRYERHILAGLSLGQITSLLLFVCAAVALLIAALQGRRGNHGPLERVHRETNKSAA